MAKSLFILVILFWVSIPALAQGHDFAVNDDTIQSQPQHSPAIVCDQSGNFIITWQDNRICYPDIYARRYDSSGTPLGSSFKVTDDPGSAAKKCPAIAIDGSGNFIITWHDFRNGQWVDPDIYAQRYNSSGTPLGTNFRVNDNPGTTEQYDPAIAINTSGNFVITWTDERNGKYDIYAQIYDAAGAPLGPNFKVNDADSELDYQLRPAVAMDDAGNFVITWRDYRNGDGGDIYVQRYDSSGVPLGFNFRVDDDAGTSIQHSPAITSDYSGNFVITWTDQRNGDWGDIYAQRYDLSGTSIGSNFKVTDDSGWAYQTYPSIASDDAGNFVITWSDTRAEHPGNIYAQRYDAEGTPLGANFKVNDVSGRQSPYSPAISMAGSGNFVITWDDVRGDWDIYAQRFNSAGIPLDSNFRVNNPNDDVGCALQCDPEIAADAYGNFAVTWTDFRFDMYGDVFAQRFNSSGVHLDSNFKVNNDLGEDNQIYPAIAMSRSGNFVITWEDTRNTGWDIYAQRYDSAGTALGANFQVSSDPLGNRYQVYSEVSMDDWGNFVVVWQDDRYWEDSHDDIFAQRFNSLGNALGGNFKVNGYDGGASQYFPAVGMDNCGNFIIAWIDRRNSDEDIYAKRYNSYGEALSSDFRVNDVIGSVYFPGWLNPAVTPSIAINDTGNFLIIWNDIRDGDPDIYAQRYDAVGTPIGSNFRVNDDAGSAYQGNAEIASGGCSFILTWHDYRNQNKDVYAQRYDLFGNPVGNNYLVPDPQYASFYQEYPAVAANKLNVYFTWMDYRRGGGSDIYAKYVHYLAGPGGDVNNDGETTVSDVVYLIIYLFKSGPPPIPELWLGDVNCDSNVDILDVVCLINYLFKS